MKKCFVCSFTFDGPGHFKVPRKEDRRKKWLESLGVTIDDSKLKSSFLCFRHFHVCDFKTNGKSVFVDESKFEKSFCEREKQSTVCAAGRQSWLRSRDVNSKLHKLFSFLTAQLEVLINCNLLRNRQSEMSQTPPEKMANLRCSYLKEPRSTKRILIPIRF